MRRMPLFRLAAACLAAWSAAAVAQCIPGQVDTSYGANNTGYTQISPTLNNFIVHEGHGVDATGEAYLPSEPAIDSSFLSIASVVAVKKNGNRDLNFGGFGSIVAQPVGPSQDVTNAIDASGNHIVALLGTSGLTLTRYTLAGSLDPTFGAGTGFVTVPLSLGLGPWQVAAGADGSIFVAIGASPGAGGTRQPVVIKVTSAGALDPTFGSGGYSFFLPGHGVSSRATSIIPLASGALLVGGRVGETSTQTQFFVARLTATGAFDPTFAGAGLNIVDLRPGARLRPAPCARLARRCHRARGAHGACERSRNHHRGGHRADSPSTGTLDTRFTPSGTLVVPGATGFNVAVQNNGSIVTSGQQAVGVATTGTLVRITRTGAIDTSFGAAGTAVIPAPGFANSSVSDVLITGNKIVVHLPATDAANTTVADFAAGVCQ